MENRCPICGKGQVAKVVGANDFCLACGAEFHPVGGGLVAAKPQRLLSDSAVDAAVREEFLAVVGREERGE